MKIPFVPNLGMLKRAVIFGSVDRVEQIDIGV